MKYTIKIFYELTVDANSEEEAEMLGTPLCRYILYNPQTDKSIFPILDVEPTGEE